eukprot:GHVP01067659.1.p1 GENE.GHVP01067659.1~~GHVP01067659.1.p1  ORF type:complete len:151 (-),score=33.43 GHVP01067659.1:463-915(-)
MSKARIVATFLHSKPSYRPGDVFRSSINLKYLSEKSQENQSNLFLNLIQIQATGALHDHKGASEIANELLKAALIATRTEGASEWSEREDFSTGESAVFLYSVDSKSNCQFLDPRNQDKNSNPKILFLSDPVSIGQDVQLLPKQTKRRME